MDVRAGAEIRRGKTSVKGLVVTANRPMGGVSDGTTGQRKSARLCQLYREADITLKVVSSFL
jgi:hypothetical protein